MALLPAESRPQYLHADGRLTITYIYGTIRRWGRSAPSLSEPFQPWLALVLTASSDPAGVSQVLHPNSASASFFRVSYDVRI